MPKLCKISCLTYSAKIPTVQEPAGVNTLFLAFSQRVSSFIESANSKPSHVNRSIKTEAGSIDLRPLFGALPNKYPASIRSIALNIKTSLFMPSTSRTIPSAFWTVKRICRMASISRFIFKLQVKVLPSECNRALLVGTFSLSEGRRFINTGRA